MYEIGKDVCSLTLIPNGSIVWRLWIQKVSLLRRECVSDEGRVSMAMTWRSEIEWFGRLKCRATGVSLSFNIVNLWEFILSLRVCPVWPTYCF